MFPLSPFAMLVEMQSQNCGTSSQQLLKCTRTSQTFANAANFTGFEFGFWTCVCHRQYFYFTTFHIGSGGEATQETTSDMMSCVTSEFVQNTVIYSSVHQHSAVTEFFS